MAKKKVTATNDDDDDAFFESLAKSTGGDVIEKIDSVKYFVDTGSLAVNYVCSGKFIAGGIPGGKLTEIFGPSSSAKSLFGANILFGCQKMKGIPVLIDCENSANKEFIKNASHCNLRRIVRHTPQSLEQVFLKMYKVIEEIRKTKGPEIPIVIVYDSIGVSPCERELREVGLPDDYSEADYKRIVKQKEQPGERAKICSRELRKLNSVMEKTNATVVILNQIRSKVGVMYGNPETTAGGGNALPFYASCRLRPQTQMKIEKKLGGKNKKILGVNVMMKNIKNKTHRPFVQAPNVQLLFDRGINPITGLLSCFLDAERIVSKSGGNFEVLPEWTENGEPYKFKSSMERNDVPMSLLLDCPKIIDAESREEVEAYLQPYLPAINVEFGADVVQEEVSDDLEDSVDEDIDENLE